MRTDDAKEKMAAIAQAVAQGQYRYTVHGAQQRIARGIRRHEIEQAIASGEIIEDYPAHHYGPACLVFGRTAEGRVLHVLCAQQPVVGIVTVYEPNPDEWEADLKIRRRNV
jgi:hypothetical protein